MRGLIYKSLNSIPSLQPPHSRLRIRNAYMRSALSPNGELVQARRLRDGAADDGDFEAGDLVARDNSGVLF